MKRYFTVLDEDGTSLHGGCTITWSLPTRNEDGTWTPGDWMPRVEGELSTYGDGYKVGTLDQIINWLGPRIFEVEVGHEIIHEKNKSIVRTCRLLREYTNWNEKTARLFACDCAERVLHIFERVFPNNDGPHRAIKTARRYIDGNATCEELKSAWEAVYYFVPKIANEAFGGLRNYLVDAVWAAAVAAEGTAVYDEKNKNLIYTAATAVASYAVEAIKIAGGNYLASAEAHWQACRLLDILEG